ncbi:MAG: DUF615 domain-containing protein, partial [Halioglobus sp.]|nr:DUF615 domain-containing protein [Halioglobus sp.]
MPEQWDDGGHDQPEQPPSKSELKRRSHYLQRLGESLLALNDSQLASIP